MASRPRSPFPSVPAQCHHVQQQYGTRGSVLRCGNGKSFHRAISRKRACIQPGDIGGLFFSKFENHVSIGPIRGRPCPCPRRAAARCDDCPDRRRFSLEGPSRETRRQCRSGMYERTLRARSDPACINPIHPHAHAVRAPDCRFTWEKCVIFHTPFLTLHSPLLPTDRMERLQRGIVEACAQVDAVDL